MSLRFATCALAIVAAACGGTAAPPKPAAALTTPPALAAPASDTDPAPVVEGDVTVARVRGMTVLVKRVPHAEFTVGQLYVRGGARNWGKDDAGIETVAFDVATGGGTRRLPKASYARRLGALGATIGAHTTGDFTVLSSKAPTAAWDETFPLLVDALLEPALPASEFELSRERELSARRHELEDGDGRLVLLNTKTIYAGHPYENRAAGTIETLSAMKHEQLAPYLAKLRETSRLVLIVVGDVDASHVTDLARRAFAAVPRGAYEERPMPALHFDAPKLYADAFKLPTNYVESSFAGPTWRDPDAVAARVAVARLGQRVFDEVRTKRNLSYAPYAGLSFGAAAPVGVLYVTAVDPSAAMKVMTDEVRKLQTELLSASELAGAKSVFLTREVESRESTEGMASGLGRALLLGDDWHLALTLPDHVRATTAEAVRAAAQKHLTNLQTVIVGEPSKLDPKIVGVR